MNLFSGRQMVRSLGKFLTDILGVFARDINLPQRLQSNTFNSVQTPYTVKRHFTDLLILTGVNATRCRQGFRDQYGRQ